MWAYNFLRTKYFHEVSPASLHAYSLKSRYGIVRGVHHAEPTRPHGTVRVVDHAVDGHIEADHA
jgi:hypothetical protein